MREYSIKMSAITDPVLKCIDNFVILAEREERGTSIIAAQKYRTAVMDIAYLTRNLVATEIANPRLTKALIIGKWQATSRYEKSDYTISIENGVIKVKKECVHEDDGVMSYECISEVPYSQFREEQENAIEHITLRTLFEFPPLEDTNRDEEVIATYSTHFDEMKQYTKRMKRDRKNSNEKLEGTANMEKRDATAAVVSYYQQTKNGLWVPEEGIGVGYISYDFKNFRSEEHEVLLYPDGRLGVQIRYLENKKWSNKVVFVEDFKECMKQLYRNSGKDKKKIESWERRDIAVQFDNYYENLLRYFTRQFVGVTPANPNIFWLHEGKTTNLWEK